MSYVPVDAPVDAQSAVEVAEPYTADVIDIVTGEAVNEKLAIWLKEAADAAKMQCSDIYQRCSAADAHTQRNAPIQNPQTVAESLEYVIHTREAADQRDAITAIESNMIIRNGQLCRIDPGEGETTASARAVTSAIEYELKQCNAKGEVKKALRAFNTYPIGGMKSYREFKDGYTCFGVESINTQCYAVSDVGRPADKQFSIHELKFLTKREMRKAGFRNLEKLGQPDGNGENKIEASGGVTFTRNDTLGMQTYKVWESWVAPPFYDWAMADFGASFGVDEFNAWVKEWRIPPPYFAERDETDGLLYMSDSANLLRIFHADSGTILHVAPNYLVTPRKFPHHTGSCYPPTDNRIDGESFIERSSDLYMMQHSLLNKWNSNMNIVGNQSMFINDRASVPDEEFEKIYTPRGRVRFSSNQNPDQLFHPFQPPNIGNDLMPGIQYAEGKIEQHGINDALKGMSNDRTATENQNNQARGQMLVNEHSDEFITNCLGPALEDMKRMIVADYTASDWYRTVGEDGQVMVDKMIKGEGISDADTIDRHFKLATVASFDYLNRGQKVATLTNMASVWLQVLPPDIQQRFFKETLESTDLDRRQIEYIEGNKGSYTDLMGEIQAMKDDPYTDIEVLPTDDHWGALTAVGQVIKGNPLTGEPPMPEFQFYPAVTRYVKLHQLAIEAMMQEQRMAEMMQQMAAGPGAQPKGATKQQPSGGQPTDPVAQARSDAQMTSPPDQTAQPGQTGRGAPPFAA